MKIERDKSIMLTQAVEKQMEKKNGKSTGHEKAKGNSFFAGSMNLPWDRIEEKRKQAQGQAMKVITDAMVKDQKMDETMDEHRSLIHALEDEISQSLDEIDAISASQEQLKQEYGITDDSREQQDLELLVKRKESMQPGSSVELTDEEKSRLKEIDERGLTDYQTRVLKLEDDKGIYQSKIEKNRAQIAGENSVIRGMKMERLKMKRQPMQTAKEEADEILEAASKEILGMMFEEGKEHIDEEAEKVKEEAEKIKEEKEEEEERIEEVKEKIEEIQEQMGSDTQPSAAVQDSGSDILTDQMLEISHGDTEVQKELEDIVNKMNLIAEDLKGAAVDTGA